MAILREQEDSLVKRCSKDEKFMLNLSIALQIGLRKSFPTKGVWFSRSHKIGIFLLGGNIGKDLDNGPA